MSKPTPSPPVLVAVLALLLLDGAAAFLPSPSVARTAARSGLIGRQPPLAPLAPFASPITSTPPININPSASASATRLRSFFGLGPAELAIIAVAGLFLIGPSKLLEFTREAGSVAGKTGSEFGDEWKELKAIPEEFQKGVEEGEIEARSRKAKAMGEVGGEEEKRSEE